MEKEISKCDQIAHQIIELLKGETYVFSKEVLKITGILLDYESIVS